MNRGLKLPFWGILPNLFGDVEISLKLPFPQHHFSDCLYMRNKVKGKHID